MPYLFRCPDRGRVFTWLQCRSTTSPLTILPPRTAFIPSSSSAAARPPSGTRFVCLSRTGECDRNTKASPMTHQTYLNFLQPQEIPVLPHASFVMRFWSCRRCGSSREKIGSFSRRNAFLKFSLNDFIFFSVERDNPVYVRFSCACFRRFLDKKVLKVNRIATALSHANVDIFARRACHVGTFPGQTRSVLWP